MQDFEQQLKQLQQQNKQWGEDLALLIKDQKAATKATLEALSDILNLQQEHNIRTDALLRRLGVIDGYGEIIGEYRDNSPDRSAGYFAGAEPEDDSPTVESGATGSDPGPQAPTQTSAPQAPTDAQEPQGTSQATTENQATAARAASYEAKKKRLGYLLCRAYMMVEYLEEPNKTKTFEEWYKFKIRLSPARMTKANRVAGLFLESEDTIHQLIRILTQD